MADKGVAFLTLDEAGAIVDCDGPVEQMFGYAPRDLIFQHISKLIPRLQYMDLMQGGRLNSRLHYLCHIGLPFSVQPHESGQFLGYLSLTDLSDQVARRVRLGVRRR
jgi:PAS domain-containing protein